MMPLCWLLALPVVNDKASEAVGAGRNVARIYLAVAVTVGGMNAMFGSDIVRLLLLAKAEACAKSAASIATSTASGICSWLFLYA